MYTTQLNSKSKGQSLENNIKYIYGGQKVDWGKISTVTDGGN